MSERPFHIPVRQLDSPRTGTWRPSSRRVGTSLLSASGYQIRETAESTPSEGNPSDEGTNSTTHPGFRLGPNWHTRTHPEGGGHDTPLEPW